MHEFSAQEWDLMDKHDDILSQRAELLERMEAGRQPPTGRRKQQEKEAEAARHRNESLRQDLQKIEKRLKEGRLPDPSLLAMETKYWASVAESLPAWEQFLLGKGPHPVDSHGQSPAQTAERKASTAQNRGLPPLPKHRPAR